MGHDSEKTTEIYLKSLECNVINKTNHDLLPCCCTYCMPPLKENQTPHAAIAIPARGIGNRRVRHFKLLRREMSHRQYFILLKPRLRKCRKWIRVSLLLRKAVSMQMIRKQFVQQEQICKNVNFCLFLPFYKQKHITLQYLPSNCE